MDIGQQDVLPPAGEMAAAVLVPINHRNDPAFGNDLLGDGGTTRDEPARILAQINDERGPLFIGAREEVERVTSYHLQADQA